MLKHPEKVENVNLGEEVGEGWRGWMDWTADSSTHSSSPVRLDGSRAWSNVARTCGPLHQTPASKQIKLQFHHLEGAVSCPSAPSPFPLSTYILTHTKLYTAASTELPPPHPPSECQPLSTAQLPRGMEGFEGRKRGMGGCGGKGDWEHARGSYCSLIPVKYFAMVKVQGERGRRKAYTAVASR